MQFSDTSNNTGILQHCHYLVSADTTKYPAKDVARNVNVWYRRVLGWIWEAAGEWTFDDTQQSTLPSATTTLVDDQRDYGLPTAAASAYGELERVEVKDSNGDWSQLRRITPQSLNGTALSERYETKGVPVEYYIEGNSLIILPAPDTTQVTASAGLRIYLSRDIVEFAYSDTTDEPGFNRNWHDVLAVGAAYDYAITKLNDNTNLLTSLKNRIDEVKQEIQKYYRRRENKDRHEGRRIRKETYR